MNNLNKYYTSKNCKIFYLEGGFSEKFISELDESCFVFHQFTWNIEQIDKATGKMWAELTLTHHEEQFSKINKLFNVRKQLIFCAPTQETHDIILQNGFNSVLLNHNCLLDYNGYTISEDSIRRYNAVINSRPFWWKRVYLAEDVKNLAYIAGNDWAKDKTSWTGYKDWNNVSVFHQIPYYKVNEIYNKSMCGLILSGCTGNNHQNLMEGANYSSSEYLLCGLPVVSTKSQGGREYWFDEKNSIICDPNAQSVKDSVDLIIEKLNNGEMNRAEIRQTQIQKMNEMRKNFITKTQEIFNDKKVDVNASKYFDDNYFHKMTDYSKRTDANIKNISKPLNFTVLDYRYSKNIGDWVQTIAACQFLPVINNLVERDGFSENNINTKHNNVLITNGWYWGDSNINYMDKIDSLIPIAMHVNECGTDPGLGVTFGENHKERFLTTNKQTLQSLVDRGITIGVRDLKTKEFFEKNNITSKLTNCLTLTLQRSKKLGKKNHVIVDERIHLTKEIREYLNNKNLDIINLDIENIPLTDKSFENKIKQAINNLDLIHTAKLVISSRLHIVLPSISIGTRAIYTAKKDSRHDGYEKLIKYWIDGPTDLKVSHLENILVDDDWLDTEILSDIRHTLKNLIRRVYQINNNPHYDDTLDKLDLT